VTVPRSASLLFLRLSLGLLMLVWGGDKFANPAHGVGVAEHFYFGLMGTAAMMPVLGALQIALGLLVALGAVRRFSYAALAVVTGVTLVGVRRSIVDPWGWYLEGTNALFFPSLIIFAAALALIAFRAEDVLSLDERLRREPVGAAPPSVLDDTRGVRARG
jgi:putative oxidoreductase